MICRPDRSCPHRPGPDRARPLRKYCGYFAGRPNACLREKRRFGGVLFEPVSYDAWLIDARLRRKLALAVIVLRSV
jgi:hypothetical protein